MCRTYVEDLIDFPVSDQYRDYYFDKGMTPQHSPKYRACRDRLADKQEALESRIQELAEAQVRKMDPETVRKVASWQPPARQRYTTIP